MQKQEFKNQRFNINTIIKYKDIWWNIEAVDFVKNEITTRNSRIVLGYNLIKEIF